MKKRPLKKLGSYKKETQEADVQQGTNHNEQSLKKSPENKLAFLESIFKKSDDIIVQPYECPIDSIHDLHFVYCEPLVDLKYIDQYILPRFLDVHIEEEHLEEEMAELFKLESLTDASKETVVNKIFEGHLLVVMNEKHLFAVNIENILKRSPEETSNETSIRGARDGFVEDVSINISLVRRRLKSASLIVERYVVGKRSNTNMALLYIEDIIDPEIVKDVQQRISNLDIDIVESSHHIETLLSDHPLSLFPLFHYTGRPDQAIECLNQGRFMLIIDGSPTVSIAPTNLALLMKSPEDSHNLYAFVSFERVLRLIALFVTTLLPGVWIALSAYNIEQIPILLIATIGVSRFGLPVSAPLEMFIILFLFELFNEAGLRLPKAVGQTVAVLGGLIVGDAAIRAGLTSPTMLVVGAITFISGFTLSNQSLSSSISVLRFAILIVSTFLGLFGVVIGFFLTTLYLSYLTSFRMPYLSSLAPLKGREIISAFLKKPWVKHRRRTSITSPSDSTRKEK
ncbi:spore germination protein [Metabacillus iocasae]|uniref:Uncharacterized protein n=1 Tax=Priestia iocasae TaxID=2291674 RepID=A0ABS2QVH9_9BACI|nr:spore germination protein [Metabacillus iocasae]MBM7703427.1 hypothetical protein [Metabacillus iocasae]